jgi:alpha-glucosidase
MLLACCRTALGVFLCIFGVLGFGLQNIASAEEPSDVLSLSSPDGSNEFVLRLAADRNQLIYRVARSKKPIVDWSPIEVRVAGVGTLTAGLAVEKVETRAIDETSELPWGKARMLRNHCREATVRFKSDNGAEWQLQVRPYDDGVAYRYGITKVGKSSTVLIEDEKTEFRLAGNPNVIYMAVDQFHNSHEAPYERKQLSELPRGKLIDKPLLAVWPEGTAAAITEGRLRNFAGLYLERPKDVGANLLRSKLSPLLGQRNAVVEAKTPVWSPWRVVLLGDAAGKLIESNLLLCLNEPADGDFTWIKPGKTTWPWWNGTIEHSPKFTPESSFAIHKQYIDFCARNKIAYHSIICVGENRPWYAQSGPPGFDPRADSDVVTPRPELNLPAILAYAKEKGVGIRFWVWWQPLSKKLEQAFATYERWGVKGLMVDFMDRDDQEMVEWQEECLRSAARHHLQIQFHGSYKPTGEQRTFPNLFNREGVLNLEYLKFTKLCTPSHNVNVAYTRLLAGPMDYHLGGFRSASRDEFQIRDELPLVMGTRCHHLAMYVVYENPMPMVCDVPSAYEGQPGFDFIVDVPTTWDETRFVAGEAGEYVVVARRKSDAWYLGGMTNWTKRTVKLPLDFLRRGSYTASLYLDRDLDGKKPNELRIESRDVTAGERLAISFASGGGMAAVIRPK